MWDLNRSGKFFFKLDDLLNKVKEKMKVLKNCSSNLFN
jgi:hypothetical protein